MARDAARRAQFSGSTLVIGELGADRPQWTTVGLAGTHERDSGRVALLDSGQYPRTGLIRLAAGIKLTVLRQARDKLVVGANALRKCRDFATLFDQIRALILPIHGIGELAV